MGDPAPEVVVRLRYGMNRRAGGRELGNGCAYLLVLADTGEAVPGAGSSGAGRKCFLVGKPNRR